MLLRTKLLLLAAVCAVVPITLSTFWSVRIASETVESESRQKGREVFAQAQRLLGQRVDALSSYLFLVMSNPALPLAVENKNAKLLFRIAESIQEGLHLNILEVVGDDGRSVYDYENPAGMPSLRLRSDLVQQLVEKNRSDKQVSVIGLEKRVPGVALEVASFLPRSAGRSPGAILMGFYLNDQFLADLKKIVAAEFCLLSKDEVVAGTFSVPPEVLRDRMRRAVGGDAWDRLGWGEDLALKVRMDGAPYYLTLKKMELKAGDLRLGVFIPLSKAEEARRRSMAFILIAGIIGVALAGALSFILGRRVMAPVQTLTHAIDEMGKGHFETQVPVTSKDEIGFLGYTFNLMIARLREVQERLMRTERLAAIGQMASGVGHELRNPLAAIKNAVYFVKSVMKKGAVGQEDKILKMLELAEREVNTTVKISNDLLEFSRATRINPIRTDVHDILSSALSTIQVSSSIRLEKRFQPDVPLVRADPDRMRQVFINLLNNAIEAMPSGGDLWIETCYNNPGVEVAVRDTGAGIPEEDQEKIFEPLFSTKVKGTGLGLAIVRGIVEAHQGQIALKSAVGQGTEFRVSLPADGSR